MTHDADHDPEFEAFLRRRSPMHRRLSQIDDAEPSADLDRIVLDRARDAIGAPSQEPIYRKSRWAMPLGLAATILIAFTVVLNIDHRRTASVSPVASNADARLAENSAAPPPVAQLMARTRAESARIGDSSGAPPTESSSTVPPAALARESTGTAERIQRQEAKRVAKAEEAPVAANLREEQTALPRRAGFSESRADAERDNAAIVADTANNPAAEAAAPRDRALAASESPLSGPLTASAPGGLMVRPQASAPAADVHASPDAWLQEINRLRAAGKNEEADRELAAFRRAYPSHPGYSLAQPPTR